MEVGVGCDIHSVIQIKERGVWTKVPNGNYDGIRDYELFSLLAGVRGSIDPIKPTVGLPEGFVLSDMGEYDGYWMGYHSFTWYTLDELMDYIGPHKDLLKDVIIRMVEISVKHNCLDVRIVIGFDS